MSYVKQTWIDRYSKISAARLNHMEEGIYQNDQAFAGYLPLTGGTVETLAVSGTFKTSSITDNDNNNYVPLTIDVEYNELDENDEIVTTVRKLHVYGYFE